MLRIPNFPEIVEEKFDFATVIEVAAFEGFARFYPNAQPETGSVIFRAEKSLERAFFMAEIEWIRSRAEMIVDQALQSLLPQYQELRPYLLDELDEADLETFAPSISDYRQLRSISQPDCIYVYDAAERAVHEFTMIFHCSWEQEHGAGVRFKNLVVTEVGDAAV